MPKDDDTDDKPGKQRCHVCGELAKGKPFVYYAGFHVSTKEQRDFWKGTTKTTSKFRDMAQYRLFVCRACLGERHASSRRMPAIGFIIASVLSLIALAAAFLFAPLNKNFLVFHILAGIATLISLIGTAWLIKQVLAPTPNKWDREFIVCDIAKEDFPDQGDTFVPPVIYNQMETRR
jgi:hypothetical protein